MEDREGGKRAEKERGEGMKIEQRGRARRDMRKRKGKRVKR